MLKQIAQMMLKHQAVRSGLPPVVRNLVMGFEDHGRSLDSFIDQIDRGVIAPAFYSDYQDLGPQQLRNRRA